MIEVNTGANGREILTSEKLPALHAAVVDACGNSNGLIGDPELRLQPCLDPVRPRVDNPARRASQSNCSFLCRDVGQNATCIWAK